MAHAVKGRVRGIEREREHAIAVGHMTAALGRMKKFPALDKLLKAKAPTPTKKAKSWEKQLAGWASALSRK